MDKKKNSLFSYKLVQISPIMILVNSGAFLSISSWFCELTELIFVMIPYISSTGYPPKRKGLWLCASSGEEPPARMTYITHFVKLMTGFADRIIPANHSTGRNMKLPVCREMNSQGKWNASKQYYLDQSMAAKGDTP